MFSHSAGNSVEGSISLLFHRGWALLSTARSIPVSALPSWYASATSDSFQPRTTRGNILRAHR
jgi:hypothetical protein